MVMSEKKSIQERISSLSKAQKVQLVIAATFTVASAVAAPSLAWFSYQSKVETMSYVNDPPSLSLAAGHQDSVQFFDLKNIDVKRETDGEYFHDFVFSVETEKSHEYDLQLVHTTNIPFVYELYRAKEDTYGTISYEIQEGNDKGTTVKYQILTGNLTDGDVTIKQDITLTNLNPENASASREIGSETVLSNTYSRTNYQTGDNYNKYVEPLYSVARHIQTNGVGFDGSEDRDYFVLRVKWNVKNEAQGNEYWDYAFNDKETDIVYICVKESADLGSSGTIAENNDNP